MIIAPLSESVSESEQTLGCRSRSVDLSWPLRFEYRVRSFQLPELEPDPPETVDFRELINEPTMDTFEPAGDVGDDRLSEDLKFSWGHRYIGE